MVAEGVSDDDFLTVLIRQAENEKRVGRECWVVGMNRLHRLTSSSRTG